MEPQEQSAPAAPQQTEVHTTEEKTSGGAGPIIGIVIIIALLIFGGLYFWGMQAQKEAEVLPFVPANNVEEAAAPVQENADLSTSDETATIEADADDAYMAQLEADLEADLGAIESY